MALPKLKFNIGDTKTLYFRWMQADKETPVDLTGLTIRFYAREKAGAAGYTINPVTATIPVGTDGRFNVVVTMPLNKTNSLYWIEREDGGGNKDTAKPAEGTDILILEK